MASAGQLMVEIGANVARLRSDMAQASNIVRTTAGQMSTAMSAVSGVMAGALAGFSAVQFARDMAATGLEVNRLSQAFANIKGSVGAASAELDYVRDLANRTGNDFLTLANSYKGIAAAAQGTSLEGEKVRSVFESIVKYGTALQLSSDQMGGTLNAMSQMISKNVVSMEEMRQQLGDRLPGAFQAAARAMNMTTGEFTELVSSGKLLATEFLPKFAAELEKVAKNSENAAGSFNRLKNEWDNLKAGLWEGGGKTIMTTLADELARVVRLASEAPSRLKIFGKTFGETLNLGMATTAANQFQRPETAEHYAGIGAGIDEPRTVANTWKEAEEQAKAYWKTYREGAEKGIKEANELVEAGHKKELSGLQDMLNEAMRLRKEHASNIIQINANIAKEKATGEDIVTSLKRGQMTPEQQQADISREASKKLTEARFAMWRGNKETAINLAEQSRQAAQGMDDTNAAIQKVQEANRLLSRIYEEQKAKAVSGFGEQEAAIGKLGDQIKELSAKPIQDLIDKAQAADLALKSAATTEFGIKGIPETVSQLDEVVRKLDEVKQKASEVQEYKLKFKGEASPVKPLSETISDIMSSLKSLPTGSEYKMNFSMGIPGYEANRLIGTGAGSYLEGNNQWKALLASQESFVDAMVEAGSSVSDAMEIFAEFAGGAATRLKIAGQIYANWQDYGYLKSAGTYQIDAWKYQQQLADIELQAKIAKAISSGVSTGGYGTTTTYGGSSSVPEVNIEKAVDIGSIIVNLNGGSSGMDNARIVAEELDAQLAEMVTSNRSRLKAALKNTWN